DRCGHERSQERLSQAQSLQATSGIAARACRSLRKGNKQSRSCPNGADRFTKFNRARDNSFGTVDAFCAQRGEEPCRFSESRSLTFVSALKVIAAIELAKNRFCEIFGIVRFSIFATVSAKRR